MTFVMWHYRNGWYVRSHFRRLPKRRADSITLPLFATPTATASAADRA